MCGRALVYYARVVAWENVWCQLPGLAAVWVLGNDGGRVREQGQRFFTPRRDVASRRATRASPPLCSRHTLQPPFHTHAHPQMRSRALDAAARLAAAARGARGAASTPAAAVDGLRQKLAEGERESVWMSDRHALRRWMQCGRREARKGSGSAQSNTRTPTLRPTTTTHNPAHRPFPRRLSGQLHPAVLLLGARPQLEGAHPQARLVEA